MNRMQKKEISFRRAQSFCFTCNAWLMMGLVALFFVGCEQNTQEVERLQAENELLRQQADANVENVEAYFEDLNEIEDNLRLIKEKENIIAGETSRDLELGERQQERINRDIQLIGELMEKNRLIIASLNNRIRNADVRIAGFEEMVTRLNQTIEEKEIEIQMLRDQLAKMNLEVDFLTARVDTLERARQRQSQQLEEQTIEMNTAYFAMGSRRELIDNNIVSREGGFLGIGRTNRLKADFDHEFFTRLDITRDLEVTIVGDSPKIITSHPSDSYELVTEDGETLIRIKNAEKFWSATRYLVIQIR